MDIAYKIIIAVIGTVIATVFLYLFRMRQLYLTVPILYDYNELTSKGKTFHLSIFNKSRKSEEDVRVEMAPNFVYTLLASSNTGISLENNILQIPRIPSMTVISVIMLAEGENFSQASISQISSKEQKGKILKQGISVPPNWANAAIVAIFFMACAPLGYWAGGVRAEREIQQIQDEQKVVLDELKALRNNGWSNYEKYAFSSLRKSYSEQEMPATVISEHFSQGTYSANIAATNKTSNLIFVDAYLIPPESELDKVVSSKSAKRITVEPGNTVKFQISTKLPRSGIQHPMHTLFNFYYGNEELMYLTYQNKFGQ